MQFIQNIIYRSLATVEFNTSKINSTSSIKFLGIIESSLTRKEHIDYINSKLNSVSYIVHSLRHVLEIKIHKQLYFSYVHVHDVMFGVNSPCSRSVFIIQKHIVRIIMKVKPKESCN
jgi:hypothetical protein